MDLLSRVRRTIRQHDLVGAGTRVVVALSGGSDSVALTRVLLALHETGELRVAGLAHFNHLLREAGHAEERFCRELAASLGLPIAVECEDVGARAAREHRSLESAARAARYEFFERARVQFGADAVALGHTRDDQAETFLLRLIRGAASRGLAGMHPRRGAFIRPLLDCRRGELREFLAASGASFVTDESNADVSIPRNRVRAELLPLLEARFNRSIVDALADEADLAREEWLWLEEAAGALETAVCQAGDTVIRLKAAALNAAPPALARMLVYRAMSRAGGGDVGFRHVEAALDVSRTGAPAFAAPGQYVERVGDFLVLTGRPEGVSGRWHPGESPVNLFRYPLSIPGEVAVAEARCVLSAEFPAGASRDEPGPSSSPGRTTAQVRMDRLAGGLVVRNRRPGDRFRPAGLDGRKKLQDYFVDEKVARGDRDGVPIVVDALDRIVWVAGFGIDDEFRVTDPAQGVLLLRLRQV
ncbi:MAG TPA: tRNA lysidine(34) synthetase TilS [Vicinamibacterales bacterium]|nr:tRNA lysidine(34) synthetase TilS [Vicinamibacterales bacterium]